LLESKDRSADIQSKFVDLAPTDKTDKTGVYSEAILFATNNAKVSNIALTGPHGSGKSSIIQSFLKKYRRPALHISLAAFVPEAEFVFNKMVSRGVIDFEDCLFPFSRRHELPRPSNRLSHISMQRIIYILGLFDKHADASLQEEILAKLDDFREAESLKTIRLKMRTKGTLVAIQERESLDNMNTVLALLVYKYWSCVVDEDYEDDEEI
jgi:GTPase SAR1 family protein